MVGDDGFLSFKKKWIVCAIGVCGETRRVGFVVVVVVGIVPCLLRCKLVCTFTLLETSN